MKYNVLQFITNIKGEYSARVSATLDNLASAKVNYFGVAQTLNNASDVLRAVVKIVDEFGNDIGYREVIDNTPEPIEEETATE
jgi:hypothetical protein